MSSRYSFIFAAASTLLIGICGCSTEEEKQRVAWDKEFGSLLKEYNALPRAGAPELSLKAARRRPVLFSTRYREDPSVAQARDAGAVGMVVTETEKPDATPSRTYENG